MQNLPTERSEFDDSFEAAEWRELEDEEAYAVSELYCDYCEQDGHTFASCPRRDDSEVQS